jgi:hypothetical protein
MGATERRKAALALLSATALVACVDLLHKGFALAGSGDVRGHERPAVVVLIGLAATVGLATAIVLVGSVPIALAGGIAVGGAAGNLVSLALWPSFAGVPDALVAGSVAFNLGDIAIGAGLALVVVAIVPFAARNRSRWREPVVLRR